MKLPKVGENFYWKDLDGIIHEEICLKIEEEDNSDLETMFFTHITKNGGGCFVTESDIIDSNSDEVKNFKKEQAKNKVKEISDYLLQKEVQDYLYEKLCNSILTPKDAKKILNILSNYD